MQQFYVGDTVKVDFILEGKLNTEWAAELTIKREGFSSQHDAVSSTDSNEGYDVTIPSASTASLTSGVYEYFVRATNTASSEVSTALDGKFFFAPDPTSTEGTGQTQFEQDLQAVEEAMRKIISGGAVHKYRIHTVVGERELEKMPLTELREHHKWLLRRVNMERECRGLKPLGNDRWRKIKMCMTPQAGRRGYRR